MKRIGIQMAGALLVLAALASCDEAQGSYYEDRLLNNAKTAANCFVLGKAHGLSPEELKVHLDRVGQYNTHPLIIYTRGYYTDTLDTYGTANAPRFGSFKAARIDAARALYNLLSCSTAQAT
jgi:hypothetical protein